MARHTDRERVRFARLFGSVSGLQDVMARPPSPELLERHRAEWPALWARLDDVVAQVEHDDTWKKGLRPS